MRYLVFLILTLLTFFSCSKKQKKEQKIASVSIEEIYKDSISCRAIVVNDSQIWFGANNGKYGAIDLKTNQVFKGRIQKDSVFPEFRSIAQTKNGIFLLSVANPALLYKVSTDKKTVKLVYQKENEKVFLTVCSF